MESDIKKSTTIIKRQRRVDGKYLITSQQLLCSPNITVPVTLIHLVWKESDNKIVTLLPA
jgi:hypothetical protein